MDAPPPEAAGTVLALRARGAFAHLDDVRLVVVAPRGTIAECAAVGDSTVTIAIELLRAFDAVRNKQPTLHLRHRTFDLGTGPLVMGILNVTPDSFYDGGRYTALDAARERAMTIGEQGAAIVDVGGQSYAAGRPIVGPDEERSRVLATIAALHRDELDLAVSVDTCHASVANAALEAGADLINDPSGLADPEMARVVATHQAGLVVMHVKGQLNLRTPEAYVYDDALGEIVDALGTLVDAALAAGISRTSLLVDPGIEFGKEPATDFEIIDRFGDLRSLGAAVLFAASRKSFLSRTLGGDADELLVPSLATAAAAILAGADVVRAHDVAETVRLARTLAFVRAGSDRA